MRSRMSRYLPALVAGTAAALVTAACGGSAGDSEGARGTDNQQDPMSAYVACMQEHGVQLTLPTGRPGGSASGRPSARPTNWPSGRPTNWPSGTPRPRASGFPGGGRQGQLFAKPDGVAEDVWQKAVQACQSVRPQFGSRDRDGESSPGAGSGRSGSPTPAGGSNSAYQNCLEDHGVPALDRANPADPAVASALKTCQVLSPAPPA